MEYEQKIKQIMESSDMSSITVKSIRRKLEEEIGIDLSARKEEIREMILNLLAQQPNEKLNEQLSEEKDSEPAEHEKDETEELSQLESDRLLALQLQGRGLRRSGRTPSRIEKKTKKPRKKRTANPNNPFMKKWKLSDSLVAVCGEQEMPRPHVVKALWKYIKDNNLQDPNDKRNIICDEKFSNIFNRSKITAFSMNKYLSPHLYPSE